jgi:L-arabinokinase
LAVVAFYISGHGFGHAARQIEVMRALRALEPGLGFVIRTSAARWMFEAAAPRPFDFHDVVVDTGVAQRDSLHIDEAATVRSAADFYRTFERRADDEAAAIRRMNVDLVIGDVPPVAFAAAARAGVPSIAVANFTWDWIYSIYKAFDDEAAHVRRAIGDAYALVGTALRLPFHGGFDTMAQVRDIPLIARRSRRDPTDTRRVLGLDPTRPVVLASFGAYGADVPLEQLEQSGEFSLLAPPREAPAGLRYEDLVAAADVVVTKPGYGIVSECIANDGALLYTSRGRFIEYDLFVREMPRFLRCRFLPMDDLRAGRWIAAVRQVLHDPAPPERIGVDGADAAARIILDALH